MKLSLLTFGTALFLTATGFAQTTKPDRYELRANLDPDTHQVEGTLHLHWTNRSEQPVNTLMFHLYMNAFKDSKSVFMKESGGQLRGVPFRGKGSITIQTLTVNGQDRMPVKNDTLVPGDNTQLRVPLQTPISPGESANIKCTFVTQLPPIFARTGYVSDFHAVAQWFPKLAVLEKDGQWASFPFHANGEFYADFATYELSARVPKGWLVGATGKLTTRQDVGAQTEYSFLATNVHDTAFVTASWLREETRVFRHPDGHITAVRFLFPPGFESSLEVHIPVTLAGLEHFGKLLGPYAHDSLTVVVPPIGAEGAAGMEYPTLFFTAGHWLGWPSIRQGGQAEITAHELAHQWFQGMVASNEDQYPMLDEGLTTWASHDLLRELYGRGASAFSVAGVGLDSFETMRWFTMRGKPLTPPSSPATTFNGNNLMYARSVYTRTAVLMETVARSWGRARFNAAIRDYADQYRFKHPTPEDLYAVFDTHYYQGFSDEVLRPALESSEVAFIRQGPQGPERFGISVPLAKSEATLDPHRHNLMDPYRLDDIAVVDAHKQPFDRTFFSHWTHRMGSALRLATQWFLP